VVIANGLRKWRHKLSYSQQELAAVAGVSPAMIVTIERYGYLPGPDVRAKLTLALGISEATLWPSLAEAVEVK